MEKPKKYEERLMDALAFNEDDLEANQSGALTRQQTARLNKERTSLALGGTFILLVGFVAVLLVLGAVNLAVMILEVLVILLAMSAFFIGLCAVIWARSAKISADLRENRAVEVEGRVDLSMTAAQNAVRYFMRVDKLRFPLKRGAFFAFKNGDPYRIYYVPRSKKILSVEWLRENDDNLLQTPPESANEAESNPLSTPEEASEATGQAKRKR